MGRGDRVTADPLTIRCRYCYAKPGEVCHTLGGGSQWPDKPRTKPHALRWADAASGRDPNEPDGATVHDLDEARVRSRAKANGFVQPKSSNR